MVLPLVRPDLAQATTWLIKFISCVYVHFQVFHAYAEYILPRLAKNPGTEQYRSMSARLMHLSQWNITG